ncbi:NFACT RNA binding domain-containing protein [Caldilinea sp.]|jgi:predicted ribosome quality control (RQC) complex YloA/Tae2 family protein|uniref:Rqc2 family fibronectin-binding protein n=1 Tax=Caldilinea sp. TaxID=2293560 RepID=UPI001B24D681|nr:NFACT RNA binding domain-containing protein [Caldilinea sp.]MBO9392723.1 NFACT family protein [Caldilinea sp.]
MHFDALTLACVVAELKRTLCPGRIQQVVLVDTHTLGFEVYAGGARHPLLIALHPDGARVHTVSYKLRRGVDGETPLLLLLRKYARGALLSDVVQPAPVERVLHLHLDHPEHGTTTLIVELIGRQPNAVLVGPAGRILETLRRVRAQEGARALLPGHVYAPPPVPAKLPPLDDGAEDYYARLTRLFDQHGPLWKVLVANIAGLSPTAAREIAFRVTGNAEAGCEGASVIALVRALQELWAPLRTGNWRPGLIEDDGQIVGFAPYPVHFWGRFLPQASMSEALERFFAQPTAIRSSDPYAALRGQVLAQVKRAQARVERRLAALAGDEPAPGEAEQLRTQANWLLAFSGQVAPGQTLLEVDTGTERLQIPLDPQLSPVEQAQRLFKRAAKLERAAQTIPQRRAQLLADLDLLAQLKLDAERATNQPELAAVLDELYRAGLLPSPKARTPKAAPVVGGPLRFRTRRGVEIVVGRNARQNEEVTFKLARPSDLWLHVRGAPGAHVVVRTAAKAAEEQDVLAAAQLAAFYSSQRGENKVDVIVTERRWVSRAPGGHPGQVVVSKERVVRVPAVEPEDVTAI